MRKIIVILFTAIVALISSQTSAQYVEIGKIDTWFNRPFRNISSGVHFMVIKAGGKQIVKKFFH